MNIFKLAAMPNKEYSTFAKDDIDVSRFIAVEYLFFTCTDLKLNILLKFNTNRMSCSAVKNSKIIFDTNTNISICVCRL